MNKEQKKIVQDTIILLDKKDIKEITGWGENTINKIFSNDDSFPAMKIGKKYQIERGSIIELYEKRKKGLNIIKLKILNFF